MTTLATRTAGVSPTTTPISGSTSGPFELVFPVEGLSCAACVGRVEKALAQVPGVVAVGVSLTSMTARVTAKSAIPAPALVAALQDEGYDIPIETRVFAVGGMSCAACQSRVERASLDIPGVTKATVSLTAETVHIESLAGLVSAQDVQQALALAGYEVTLRDDAVADSVRKADSARRELLHWLGAAVLSLPFLVNMGFELLNGRPSLGPWMQLALATPVQFYFGWRFYVGAFKALRARAANMDVLVVLGTTAAYLLSLWLVITGHHAHLYFESAAVVITLILFGKWLEGRARQATNTAIEALAALRSPFARVVRGADAIDVPLDAVRGGDVVMVKPGERLPVDGIIIDGASSVDEAHMTGESRPVDKAPGDLVTGGAINGAGLLRIRATTVGSASRLSRIIRLVERAQASKAPIQQRVDQISGVFVPVVIGIALLTGVGWMIAGASATQALVNAIAVLVISCPCALGLATPAAVSVGIGAGARQGILIKDAGALDLARGITAVVFDKTGTLTHGRPSIVDVVAVDGDDAALIRLVASAQVGSEHRLAHAVLTLAAARAIVLSTPAHFTAKPGQGLTAMVDSVTVHVGNARLMRALGVDTAALGAVADANEAKGRTLLWVATGTDAPRLAGLLTASDTVREHAERTVRALKATGIETIMLTGDNRRAAGLVAEAVGIERVIAGVVPEMKAGVIRELKAAGKVVAFVGDGINDAPALAEADVGIAMGSGSEAALEAATVALTRDELDLLPALLDLSRRTSAKITQNLFWAFIYNVVAIPLAALGLLGPAIAGGAMAMSSVCVVLNALLLRRWRAHAIL